MMYTFTRCWLDSLLQNKGVLTTQQGRHFQQFNNPFWKNLHCLWHAKHTFIQSWFDSFLQNKGVLTTTQQGIHFQEFNNLFWKTYIDSDMPNIHLFSLGSTACCRIKEYWRQHSRGYTVSNSTVPFGKLTLPLTCHTWPPDCCVRATFMWNRLSFYCFILSIVIVS